MAFVVLSAKFKEQSIASACFSNAMLISEEKASPLMGPTTPKQSWVLRKAVSADASALADCMLAAYEAYSDRLGGQSLPPMSADYEDEIRNYPVWVAEIEGAIAGGLILAPQTDAITIANVAVHPNFQGCGLGKALMAHAEAQAAALNYEELRLATHAALTENAEFYSRLGWLEIERDELRVYMRKSLHSS